MLKIKDAEYDRIQLRRFRQDSVLCRVGGERVKKGYWWSVASAVIPYRERNRKDSRLWYAQYCVQGVIRHKIWNLRGWRYPCRLYGTLGK
jgi:hypothetical protein